MLEIFAYSISVLSIIAWTLHYILSGVLEMKLRYKAGNNTDKSSTTKLMMLLFWPAWCLFIDRKMYLTPVSAHADKLYKSAELLCKSLDKKQLSQLLRYSYFAVEAGSFTYVITPTRVVSSEKSGEKTFIHCVDWYAYGTQRPPCFDRMLAIKLLLDVSFVSFALISNVVDIRGKQDFLNMKDGDFIRSYGLYLVEQGVISEKRLMRELVFHWDRDMGRYWR